MEQFWINPTGRQKSEAKKKQLNCFIKNIKVSRDLKI